MRLSAVPLQKRQCCLVKLIHLFIDRRVSTTLKNHQFSLLDVLRQWVGKTGRCDQIVPTERDLRWRFDAAELGMSIVGDHCVGLSHECVQWLYRSSFNKSG